MASSHSDVSGFEEYEDVNEIILPVEIWSKIFGYLKTRNSVKLVCKSWLQMIRDDFKFSSELSLNSIDQMDTEEINSIISNMKKLKTLRALNNWHPQITYPGDRENSFNFPIIECSPLHIDCTLCPSLERVVVPVTLNTKITGPEVTFYTNEFEVENIDRMLPKWAAVSKVWFDPQKKKFQNLGLENISELCLKLDDKGRFVEGLEKIGASMKYLDSLCIWVDYVKRDEHPNHNIDYCLPLLENLPDDLHLDLTMFDDAIGNEYFYSFIQHFALKITSMRVDFHMYLDEFLYLDYGWIRYFRNLEKLVLDGYGNADYDGDFIIEEFCQNPLTKLKEFRYPRNVYMTDKFLMKIHEAFPALDTFEIDGDIRAFEHYFDGEERSWRIENLIAVLQSLLLIENLTFSNHITMKKVSFRHNRFEYESDLSLSETENIFATAFDLVKKFPMDSVLIINENIYGYKIVKRKDMLPQIYHKKCCTDLEERCTLRWSYHSVCKIRPRNKT